MSEEKLKEIIARGKNADEWLNHPEFRHVVTLIKAQLVGEFEKTKFKDSDEREEIWRKLQSINAIQSMMKRTIRDARKAEETLLQRIKNKLN